MVERSGPAAAAAPDAGAPDGPGVLLPARLLVAVRLGVCTPPARRGGTGLDVGAGAVVSNGTSTAAVGHAVEDSRGAFAGLVEGPDDDVSTAVALP